MFPICLTLEFDEAKTFVEFHFFFQFRIHTHHTYQPGLFRTFHTKVSTLTNGITHLAIL